MLSLMIEILSGVALAIVAIPLWKSCGRYEKHIIAVSLIIAGLLYPLLGLFNSVPLEALKYEFLGLLGTIFFGVLGIKYSFWFLALGWFLHGPWDFLVPTLEDVSHMPSWYAGLCLGFDVVAGSYLAYRAYNLSSQLPQSTQQV